MKTTGTRFDEFGATIDWIERALQPHRRLSAHLLPRLRNAVAENFTSWLRDAKANEVPGLVLCVNRHLESNSDPAHVVALMERAFTFYEPNADEVGGLAEKLMQVHRSHHVMLQCMVLASFLNKLEGGRIRPPDDVRPDLWCRFADRDIAIEVTSHNLDREDRRKLDAGIGEAGAMDIWAEDEFREFWTNTVSPKLAKASDKVPWVLVAWEGDPMYDLLPAVEEHGFLALFQRNRVDPSPLSGLVFIPYDSDPELIAFDDSETRGVTLTGAEIEGLAGVLSINPLSRFGFWPKAVLSDEGL